MPELKIIISAENQKALDELKQLQEKLFQLQETVKNYKGDWPLTHTIETKIPELQAKITALQGTLTKAGVEFDNFGNNTQKIALGSNKAGLALNDLSRIAQDAPYGFIGISNNLNPMIESFGRLAATEGGTKKALTAMLNGLSGPAGLGLAIGAVSALLVVFSKDITQAFEGPIDKLKKLREELAKLNEDIYKIAGAAQSNQLIGNILSNKVANQKLDITTRQNALIELKKLYQDNKEIQDLDIKNINNYTASYLLSINNKAAIQQSEIGKEKNYTSALTFANSEYKKITAERDKLINNTYATTKQLEQGKTTDILRNEIKSSYVIPLQKAQVDINNAKASLSRTIDEVLKFKTPEKGDNKISELDKALQSFNKDILEGDNLLKAGKLFAKSGEDSFALHQLNAIDKAIKSIAGISGPAADAAIQKLLQQENAIYDKYYSGKPKVSREQLDTSNVFKEGPTRNLGNLFGGGETKLDPQRTARAMTMLDKEANTIFIKGQIDKEKELSKILKRQQSDYERFANTIAGSATNAFMGLFDAMERGLNIGEALDEMFKNLVKQLAAAVIQALIFEAIMKAIKNIASGGGEAAAGGIFSIADMLMSGVSQNAAGGITTRASIGMIGEAGPEAIMPLSKLSSFLNTSFNAGSMSADSSSNSGQFVLRGQDLLLAVNRSQKASNIKGQSISLA